MTGTVSGRRRSKRGPDECGGPGGALHDAHRRDRLRGHHRHLRVHLEEEETRGGRKCKFRIFRYFDILGKDYPVYRVSYRIKLSLFWDALMYETNWTLNLCSMFKLKVICFFSYSVKRYRCMYCIFLFYLAENNELIMINQENFCSNLMKSQFPNLL